MAVARGSVLSDVSAEMGVVGRRALSEEEQCVGTGSKFYIKTTFYFILISVTYSFHKHVLNIF